MRLLYLMPAEGFGGAERQGAYHIAELPHHGVDVDAFTGPGEPLETALREAKVAHEYFEYFPAAAEALSTPQRSARHAAHWLVALARSTRELERRIRGRRFDLIFANRTFAWLVAAALSRRLRIPYVIRAGSRPAHPALAACLALLRGIAPPAAAFYNCGAVERVLAPHLRCSSILLANAVDVARFVPVSREGRRAARTRLGLPHDDPLVGLAARPAPEKGFAFFGKVVAGVRAQNPRARFVVAGEFGWRAQYEAELRASGLGPAVRFLGHVDAMQDFYASTDVVVLTSRARSIEASPNALLEAMAAGRPVVATEVGGVPELVSQGREGYLARDGDAREFAARVVTLLDAPGHAEQLGQRGRERAEAHHQVPFVVAQLARSVRSIAAAPSSASPPIP